MIYIISQIIGFIAIIFSLTAYHRKTKKTILRNMIISNVLNLFHYLLLGAFSGCLTKLLAVFRDYFIILKEKYPKLSNVFYLLIFITIYLFTTIFTYNGIISILPLLAATIYIIFIWNGNEIKIKKTAFFCYFLWLIYNIFVLSISGVISNTIAITSTYIAIINTKKMK